MKYDVMFVGGSFPNPAGGGSVNYVYRLLSLVNGFSYSVLTANADKKANETFDKQYKHRIVRSKYLSHVLKPYNGLWLKRRLYLVVAILITIRNIARYNPKLVIFTEFSMLSLSLFFIKPFLNFKIGLFTYAEELTQVQRGNRWLEKTLLKSVLRKSCILITVCDYTANIICNICDIKGKIVKITPPVIRIQGIQKENPLRHKKNEVILLTVARLEERKGHVDVIRVLNRLRSHFPNIHYVIVGKGPYEDIIKKEIYKTGTTNNVHLLGKLSDEELIRQYSNADIFVMPHKELGNGDTEGCPTVFLEAGSYHLPVVGGDAGGVSDAIVHNKTGYICDHTKQDDLYKYLLSLILDEDLRKRMGDEGYSYSSNFVVEKQSMLFNNIIVDTLKSIV